VRVLLSPAALAEDFPVVLQQVVEAVQAVVLLAVQWDRVIALFQRLTAVRACCAWRVHALASLAAVLLFARLYAVFALPLEALVLVPAGHPDVVRHLLLALPERTVQQLEEVAQEAVLLPKQLVQVLLVPLADDGAAGVAVRAQRVEKPLVVCDVRAWRGLHAVLLALLSKRLMSMTSPFTSSWYSLTVHSRTHLFLLLRPKTLWSNSQLLFLQTALSKFSRLWSTFCSANRSGRARWPSVRSALAAVELPLYLSNEGWRSYRPGVRRVKDLVPWRSKCWCCNSWTGGQDTAQG